MRVPQALVTQREFRPAHGDRLAAELDLDKLGLMILNHRDSHFWVVDGQHRLYALLKFGFTSTDRFDCEVYEDLTDAQMAEMFLGRDTRRAISIFDKFHVACTAGRKRENDIRRMVEANGLRVGRTRTDNTIGAVGALGRVYDRSGDTVLGQTLRALRDGYAGDPAAFSPELIQGTGLVFNRYNGRTNERHMITTLAGIKHGHRGLIQRARALHEKTGSSLDQCVAAAIVEAYNKGMAKFRDRLTDWWKGNGEKAGSSSEA
jgi:hypothetical protein